MRCDGMNNVGAALGILKVRTEGVMAMLGVMSETSPSWFLSTFSRDFGEGFNLEKALLSIVSIRVSSISSTLAQERKRL